MYKEKAIAIIPARSGSKGLPDKNIRLLKGKPLLAYSIKEAQKSGLFDTIHVSTDSEDYSKLAAAYGADQAFLRNRENAADRSSTWDAVREVLCRYASIGKRFDICVLLQPTSPLRKAEDIVKAYHLFSRTEVRSVVSVTEVEHPVQWCFPLGEDGSMEAFASSPYRNTRRQDLVKQFRENGAIYIVRTEDVMNSDFDLYVNGCYAYVMEQARSVDIDTLTDFRMAEILLQENE